VSSSISGTGRAVRDATEQFLVGDASALADELTEALLAVSAHVAAFSKRVPAQGPLARDLRAIDEAFAQSVALARRLSVAIRTHRDPGAYADVARIARDLGRHLVPAMPEGVAFTIVCPTGPMLVAVPPPDVRRVLSVVVRRLLEGLADRSGELTLEVAEVRGGPTSPADVRVQIGHRHLRPGVAADAAEDVRASVNATGGSVEPCARPGGGAAVVLLLPSA
jgi:hypothetical protein